MTGEILHVIYCVVIFVFILYDMLYSRITIQAQAIKEDIGYPPYIKNDTKLDAQYSMVSSYCFHYSLICDISKDNQLGEPHS